MQFTKLLAALALLSVVACGGKTKKEETAATEPVAASQESTEPEAASDTTTDEAKPAKLGEVIYFEFDQSELSDLARETLAENAEWLKEDPKRTLTIEGHTDEVGTTDYNLALGERRARAAKEYLVRLGVDEKRVSIITYGEEKPASPDDALNRRSVFVATKK